MDKPDHLSLRSLDFKTPAQRAAARDILLLWPLTKNFAEISRRSGWSEPHLRDVYNDYFETAADPDDAARPQDLDVADVPADNNAAYREGYRDGYRDGYSDAEN